MMFSCVGAFADIQTCVAIEDYMYDVRKVYVDDNVESDRNKPISTALSSSNTVTDEDGNNAINLNGWSALTLVPAGEFIDSDRVVVSFSVKPSGASFADAVSSGSFDKTKRSFVAFGIYSGGSGETGKLGVYSGTNLSSVDNSLWGWFNWGSGANIDVPQTNDENNGYVKVAAIYERVADEDTGAYSVYMRSLTFNGNEILTDKLKTGSNASANWWSDDLNSTFRLQNRTGSGTLDNYYDDFLIYAPEDFKIKNLDYNDDGYGVKAEFTCGVNVSDDAKVKLVSADGISDCTITAGDIKKETSIDFDKKIDLEKESYYITTEGISAFDGSVLENGRVLLSERPAEVKSMSATKTADGIDGTFVIDALDNKSVCAVMSAWRGNECLDFTVQEISLDTTIGETPHVVSLSSEESAEADTVQMFLINSIKDMKIISDVTQAALK